MADRPKVQGLRTRLTLSIALILVAAVGTTFVVIYRGTGSTLRDQIDRELYTESDALIRQGVASSSDSNAAAREARRYVRSQAFGPSARLLIVTLKDGRMVTNDPELLGLAGDLDRENAPQQRREDGQIHRLLHTRDRFSTVQLTDIGQVRVLTRPAVAGGRRVATVRVGEPLAPVEQAQDGVARTFLVAGSLTLLAALGAGYLVAARTADPLRRMARTAAAIDAGDLSHRIGATGPSKEIRTLSEAFDHMLDRLDGAFARQREFVSDASHELRTPLTVISGQLQVLARSAEVTPDEVRHVNAVVGREVARMERLVNDLLLLARTEEGAPVTTQPVDVGSFMREQLAAVEPTANRRFELGHVAEGQIQADPDALSQAFRNLTRNAVEHTAEGGLVRLSADAHGDAVRFSVEDDGPGIPAAERSRIFDRFHGTRTATKRGGGLGLAIARAIVTAHAGRIWADEATTGGARVSFELGGPSSAAMADTRRR